MAIAENGVKILPTIINRPGRVHERYRQTTDRQTDSKYPNVT